MSVKEKLTAIADAIRDKTGVTDALNLDDMASGVNEVFESGKQKEWSDFWDEYQDCGKRIDYHYAFSYSWNNKIFKPKYQIKPTNAYQMFYRAKKLMGEISEVINIDFSKCTDFTQTFQDVGVSRLGVLDLRNAKSASGIVTNMYDLETIDKILIGENFPAVFGFINSSKLKNVVIEGIMPQDFTAPNSPLTVTSLKSIINSLKDYTDGSEYSHTITLNTSAFEALETEGATAEYNGAACTWAELVDNKKWNLVKG